MVTETESKKQKLTLSVDASVIEKAKNLGLNISEITEAVLRGFTFEPQESEKEALYKKYRELFDVMLPLLQKYGVWVDIAESAVIDDKGNDYGTTTILLGPQGKFYAEDPEAEFDDIEKIKLHEFHDPSKILTNLISAMARGAERNKEKLTEIELARRIVKAIASTMHPKQSDVFVASSG